MQQDAGGYRIGGLPFTPGPGDVIVPGLPVSITGVYGDGGALAASIAPDLLATDPVAYLGGTTSSFILEAYGGSFGALPLARAFGPGRSVVEFERGRDGGIKIDAVVPGRGGSSPAPLSRPGSARDGVGRGDGAARTFEPAPMPNRSLGAGPGTEGSRGGDSGGRAAGSRPPVAGGPPGADAGNGRRR